MHRDNWTSRSQRRGAVMVFAAVILVIMFGFVAFSVDVGYMAMTKGQLQNAADAAALAGVRELMNGQDAVRLAARNIALENAAAGEPVSLTDADIEIGLFDFADKSFTVTSTGANAVRVTTRVADRPLFFAPVLRSYDFDVEARSIAMLNPRDIVFVVDLSGSMNDDTEPCWAVDAINDRFAPLGYANVTGPLLSDLYTDLGFGAYPGSVQYIGAPLGVASDKYAFAEMTKDGGPLASAALDAWYRITDTDDEATRKAKGYRWLIDYQLASLMPAALPVPDSRVNYGYWEKYLDYVLQGAWVGNPPPPPPSSGGGGGGGSGGGGGGGGGGGPSPPLGYIPRNGFRDIAPLRSLEGPRSLGLVASIGSLPVRDLLLARAGQTSSLPGCPRRGASDWLYVPSQDGDRITGFNNPNSYTFPSSSADISAWKNQLGYVTYVQFMLDWGRDRSPEADNGANADPSLAGKTPLSPLSPSCPRHWESTAGGSYQFPPRTQPMHAVRRAMIAAIDRVEQMNAGIAVGYGDNVGVVTYDGLDAHHAPVLAQPLTADYDEAMLACTNLAAVSDIGATTATEVGLLLARDHLQTSEEGGAGRSFANKVIVLLTDGVPNAWSSTNGEISGYINSNPSAEFYGADYIWYNACLVQAARSTNDRITLYPVGMGLGTDFDFMDRMARLAGTDEGGLSVRGTGNPADYEDRLSEIFDEIVLNPGGRLVE